MLPSIRWMVCAKEMVEKNIKIIELVTSCFMVLFVVLVFAKDNVSVLREACTGELFHAVFANELKKRTVSNSQRLSVNEFDL